MIEFLVVPQIVVLEGDGESAYGWIQGDEAHFALFSRIRFQNYMPLSYLLKKLHLHYEGGTYAPEYCKLSDIKLQDSQNPIRLGQQLPNQTDRGRLAREEKVVDDNGKKSQDKKLLRGAQFSFFHLLVMKKFPRSCFFSSKLPTDGAVQADPTKVVYPTLKPKLM